MSKTEFFAKTFQGIVRFRNCVSLHKQENRSGRPSYFVFIGYDSKGKRVRRSLGLDEGKAYALVTEINQRISQGRLAEAANAFDVATDLEVKASLRKLQGHGVTLAQAVDFFLAHHRPTAGHLTVDEASKLFLDDLKRRGRAPKYITSFKETYLPPFVKEFGQRRLVAITLEDAESFIYKTKAGLNAKSKGEFIGRLRVFFNTMAKLGFYQKELNPFEKLERPQSSKDEETLSESDRVVGIVEITTFLDFLAKNELWDLLAVNVAELFCGVRSDEAQLLNWDSINLRRGIIDLAARITKKRRRRVVDIPENALYWFQMAFDGMKGEWKMRSESGFRQKMRRVKVALRFANNDHDLNFSFEQNFARVSFASYSYAQFGAEKTAAAMGHTASVAVLHTNYREVVSKVEAQCYFKILPAHANKITLLRDSKTDEISLNEVEL